MIRDGQIIGFRLLSENLDDKDNWQTEEDKQKKRDHELARELAK